MRNCLALAGLLLLAVLTSPAHAANYSWRWWGVLDMPAVYSTPDAACAAYSAFWRYTHVGILADSEKTHDMGAPTYKCLNTNDQGGHRDIWVYRHGDDCPEGSTYDDATGTCVGAPDCSAKKGQSFPFSRSGQAGDGELIWDIGVGGSKGNNWNLSSQDACNDGCAAKVTRSKCAVRVSGSYVCGGTAEYSGAACSASTSGPASPSPSEVLPEPKTEQVNQPCIYETLPDGTQRCRSAKKTDAEGQICGEFNGKRLCPDRQPKTDGTTIDTTVKTQTNPDGSKTITKTDTATKEVCVGAGACSSTTTTTTTTTHVDAHGNKTGESSTCTGSACPSEGNPDGDGDGIGDCTGDDCGEGGGVPELDDGVPGFGEALGDFLGRAGSAPIVSSLDGIGLEGVGTCSFPSVTVEYLGTLNFDVICEQSGWLDVLYGLMLAVWSLAAVRLFFTA